MRKRVGDGFHRFGEMKSLPTVWCVVGEEEKRKCLVSPFLVWLHQSKGGGEMREGWGYSGLQALQQKTAVDNTVQQR